MEVAQSAMCVVLALHLPIDCDSFLRCVTIASSGHFRGRPTFGFRVGTVTGVVDTLPS